MDTDFLIFLASGAVLLTISYLVFRNLPRWIEKFFTLSPFNKLDKTLTHFLADSLGIMVLVAAIVYGVLLLPEATALVAVLLTVASGAFIFISEGWFGDALAGVSLQLFPQFKIGDWVTLAENQRGQVKRLGLFRTELVTIDLDVISIKNADVIGKNLINHSGIPLRRVDIIAHTAGYGDFGDDIYAYKLAVLDIAEEVQDEICPEARESGKMPSVFFSEFGSSSDHLHIIYFSYDRDDYYGKTLDVMHTALAAKLRPQGVVLGQVNANTIDNILSFQPKRRKKTRTQKKTGWIELSIQNLHNFMVADNER